MLSNNIIHALEIDRIHDASFFGILQFAINVLMIPNRIIPRNMINRTYFLIDFVLNISKFVFVTFLPES
jgi:hypothetical protein